MSGPSAAVVALADRARGLLKGKPAFGHSLLADFGGDGLLYIYPNSTVSAVTIRYEAECTLTLSLQTLSDMENQKITAFKAWWSGALKVDGDREVAEKFAALITGK